MTLNVPVPNDDDVLLGVTHLRIGGELVRLYRCPFCRFKNIHEDEITHHIRYNEDSRHAVVDIDKLDKSLYIVTKEQGHYIYEKKEDLPLPWIKCPWCNYKDKIEHDLESHFYESKECRKRLYRMKVPSNELYFTSYAWKYSDLESRLSKALRLAKRKSGITE